MLRVVPSVVMVRSGGQTILIDAGLELDPDQNLPRTGQTIRRLESASIDLGSVTDVVLTHMHMDHVGWTPSAGCSSTGLSSGCDRTCESTSRPRKSGYGRRRHVPRHAQECRHPS